MISGFNHNIQHNGHLYHIQTEDSGVENPHIITLLYQSGTIIAKKKTSYQELLHLGNRETVVRELMEEQHKAMLRELVRGGFDRSATSAPARAPEVPAQASAPVKNRAPAVPAPQVAPQVAIVAAETEGDVIKPEEIASLFGSTNKEEKSLDEIILSYLSDESA